MDTRKFDTLTKSLATGTSRRSVIGGLFGGAFGITGLSRAAAGPAPKVDICHYDADNDVFFMINVSSNSLSGHLGHGDFEPADLACDTDQQVAESGCSCECTDPVESCAAHMQFSDSGCSCVCHVYETEEPQCYWMENYTGDSCWLPTSYDEAQCFALNSCGEGGGQSGGGCYMWATTTAP